MNAREPGAPWTLLAFAGASLIAFGLFGVDRAANAVVWALAAVFMVFLIRHLAFAASALSSAPLDMRSRAGFDWGYQPRVTVLVPCRNEALVAEGMVETILRLDYPHALLELIVIDDGSDDATPQILDELSRRDNRLVCVHRPAGSPGGKSGALNAALEIATGDVIVVFDADHRPRSDVLRRLVRHFADPRVAAVQGRCIVRNSEESGLAKTIAVDYYCGYLVNEYGRQSLFNLPAYGGANCAVRATILRELGGWNENSVTEDTDLTLRVVLGGYQVRFDVTAIDTEESVQTFKRFWRQRYRWARGHQRAWRDYRRDVWRAPTLTLLQKFETTMFLLVYHVPGMCGLGLLILLLRALGVFTWGNGIDLTPIATLLFLGPLLELASGLIVSRAPRRSALGILLFLPAFLVFTVVCSKAWIDGILGHAYTWSKTPRSGAGQRNTIASELGASELGGAARLGEPVPT
jgi:1,2-diacylglycerol 3-beta-glucosyltransferase